MAISAANSGSKTFIIVAVILVALAGGYYFYQSGSKTSTDATSGAASDSLNTTTTAGTDSDGVLVGADVYSLLGQIQSLKIDPTFFAKTVYQSLVDYTVVIPPEPVGRPNPFAPLSGGSTAQPRDAAAAARALQQ